MSEVAALSGSNTQNSFDVKRTRNTKEAEAVHREEDVENDQQDADRGTNVDTEI